MLMYRQALAAVNGPNPTRRSIKGSPEEGMIVASRKAPINIRSIDKLNHVKCLRKGMFFEIIVKIGSSIIPANITKIIGR